MILVHCEDLASSSKKVFLSTFWYGLVPSIFQQTPNQSNTKLGSHSPVKTYNAVAMLQRQLVHFIDVQQGEIESP